MTTTSTPKRSFQKTPLPEAASLPNQRRRHHIDAAGQVLGRLSTHAATLLRGKHKTLYTPSLDCGDFVVITNAKDVKITGHKMEQKFYFSHSGYASGAKTTPLARVMEKNPAKVVFLSVKRMIPSNRLRSRQLKRLRIYPGAERL